MKKYLSMAAAGLFLFSACSNDEDITNGNGSEADLTGQELVLKVANTGDGLTTRASRPLYSSEAAQAIDKVKVVIFKLGNNDAIESCVYDKEYTDWNTTSGTNYGTKTDGTNDHGKYASLNLKKEITTGDKGLDPGSYMVYAVGYNGATGTPYSYSPTMNVLVKDYAQASNFEFVTATTTAGAEEIFAGSIAKITVDADRNFDITTGGSNANVLYLHRQVAGTFGYFQNIPAGSVDGTMAATNLRLVASSKNTELQMTNFNSDFRTTGTDVQYMVNGVAGSSAATADAKFFATNTENNDAFIVYDIKLSEWFTGTPMDTNSDGILNGEDAGDGENSTWEIPASMTGFNAIKGTVFGGNFVIPFLQKTETRTFELQLTNDDGEGNVTILRRWTVGLGKAQTNVANTVDGNTIATEAVGALTYSIVRNHLYTIGRKDIAEPTEPTGPTDPENPEDLSKGQTLTIRVNDNWEVLNKLVVEPEI